MRRPAAALLLLALAACGSSDPQPVTLQDRALREAVLAFVAGQQDDGREQYERPPAAAARDLAQAVVALGGGDRSAAAALAARQEYEVVPLSDGVLALAPRRLPDERGWGLYAVRPGGVDVAVEVPHPRADLDTESLGAELADAAGARYLLVAGAGRDAADGAADVAHESDAVFTAVHRALAEAGVPAVQLHGFAANSLPGTDLVVSPGASGMSRLVRDVARETSAAGLEVCRAWRERCGRLEGRTNEQGRASRDVGGVFLHLEVSRDVRRGERRAALVDVLTRVLRP